jgi:hypothetical protein
MLRANIHAWREHRRGKANLRALPAPAYDRACAQRRCPWELTLSQCNLVRLAITAAALLLAVPAVAQTPAPAPTAVMDMRDFARVAVPNSTAARFNCTNADRCGRGSYAVLRLNARLGVEPTADLNRRRMNARAETLRRNTERFSAVEVGDTVSNETCGSQQLRAEVKVTRRDGVAEHAVDGVLFRGQTGVLLTSTAVDQNTARRNYTMFLMVACVVLDQHLAATAAPAPAAATPAPSAGTAAPAAAPSWD